MLQTGHPVGAGLLPHGPVPTPFTRCAGAPPVAPRRGLLGHVGLLPVSDSHQRAAGAALELQGAAHQALAVQVLSGLAEGDVVLVQVPSGAGGGTRTGTGGTNPFTGGAGNVQQGNAPPVVVNGDGPGVAPDGGGATK